MLELLHIENIAIIEAADIEFAPGFNALTGETGAGKSIVIDSLSAVLGQRTSRELIRTGADKAFVSAAFSGVEPGLTEVITYSQSPKAMTTDKITEPILFFIALALLFLLPQLLFQVLGKRFSAPVFFPGAKLPPQQLFQRLRRKVPLELPADGDGDRARLLRDDDDHRIRDLACADAHGDGTYSSVG